VLPQGLQEASVTKPVAFMSSTQNRSKQPAKLSYSIIEAAFKGSLVLAFSTGLI